ncbi:unnamed protein product [Pieris macdunnoughi]|uniref:Uncharacterized protein n=1 Tax=Pieris macdunnoughi TaxID=345717 RepID=A0A821LYT9_9NEOP|nr:unnamed protein product [Pieris macdunnoughi]
MEGNREKLRKSIENNNETEVQDLLSHSLDPNYEGGWPIRLAARLGFYNIVKLFLQFGANPHLLSESGASTLQLAVYSTKNWDLDNWNFLLSCCDSSQLADGAAVAIIFGNTDAFKKIIRTGRCNTNIPTSLTGKTVEDLAKGYKLNYLLNPSQNNSLQVTSTLSLPSPRHSRQHRTDVRRSPVPQHRNLSPSVANFFNIAAQRLTPPRSPLRPTFSPTH